MLITLENINKTYVGGTSLHVLKDLSLEIEEGEFISIMGASGSGKSTLLNIIGLLDTYDTGKYILDGVLMKDLSERTAADYRNKMIGFVFQSFNLISYKTALENVMLPMYYGGVPRKERTRRAMENLARLGMKDRATHLPTEMSGGQKQRVAIARAISMHPKLILADEPTGALDSATSVEVMNILRQINREEGKTIVMVTHSQEMAELTDKIINIKDGRIGSITNV